VSGWHLGEAVEYKNICEAANTPSFSKPCAHQMISHHAKMIPHSGIVAMLRRRKISQYRKSESTLRKMLVSH
jgi:hypothetical protein